VTIPYWRNSSPSFLGTRFGLYTYCDCTQAKKKGAFSLSGWGVPNVEGRGTTPLWKGIDQNSFWPRTCVDLAISMLLFLSLVEKCACANLYIYISYISMLYYYIYIYSQLYKVYICIIIWYNTYHTYIVVMKHLHTSQTISPVEKWWIYNLI
jgi:hypothetical protein